jgi:hypothetical protein
VLQSPHCGPSVQTQGTGPHFDSVSAGVAAVVPSLTLSVFASVDVSVVAAGSVVSADESAGTAGVSSSAIAAVESHPSSADTNSAASFRFTADLLAGFVDGIGSGCDRHGRFGLRPVANECLATNMPRSAVRVINRLSTPDISTKAANGAQC